MLRESYRNHTGHSQRAQHYGPLRSLAEDARAIGEPRHVLGVVIACTGVILVIVGALLGWALGGL